MSDEAVESKTGKTWSRWFKHLDAAGGKKMTHQEIVAHLHDKHNVRPWWQQMVAVKTLRISWNDGTDLVVAFYPKGEGKCQVVAQHAKLKDAKTSAKMKKFWADALDRLKEILEG